MPFNTWAVWSFHMRFSMDQNSTLSTLNKEDTGMASDPACTPAALCGPASESSYKAPDSCQKSLRKGLPDLQDEDEAEAVKDLSDCRLCPRDCRVNRLKGEKGFCGEGGTIRAARAALYYTEEPVISGSRGSGTVFFAGCNLGCIYCQNRQISRPGAFPSGALEKDTSSIRNSPSSVSRQNVSGQNLSRQSLSQQNLSDIRKSLPRLLEISPDRMAEIFLELQEQGAHNINLVTPEHFVPLLVPALRRAKKQGLSIPVVYNTGSYERVEAVKALEGLVDVWLPDLKYVSSELSARHTGAGDYFQYASAAIAEMVRQCPEPVFSDGSHTIDCPDDADDPIMVHGVLVRHLALPGCGEDSRAVLRYLYETYGDRIFISIMNQYTPMPQVLHSHPDPDLCRRLSEAEYEALVDFAIDLGITNGFIQESDTVSPSYIPVFDGTGILPAARR